MLARALGSSALAAQQAGVLAAARQAGVLLALAPVAAAAAKRPLRPRPLPRSQQETCPSWTSRTRRRTPRRARPSTRSADTCSAARALARALRPVLRPAAGRRACCRTSGRSASLRGCPCCTAHNARARPSARQALRSAAAWAPARQRLALALALVARVRVRALERTAPMREQPERPQAEPAVALRCPAASGRSRGRTAPLAGSGDRSCCNSSPRDSTTSRAHGSRSERAHDASNGERSSADGVVDRRGETVFDSVR